jgi:hypothetical protein
LQQQNPARFVFRHRAQFTGLATGHIEPVPEGAFRFTHRLDGPA